VNNGCAPMQLRELIEDLWPELVLHKLPPKKSHA
jgi:hypothetical protein